MEQVQADRMILEDLLVSIQRDMGLVVHEAISIRRGWLNLKWKLETDQGTYLLKQYNRERFKLYDEEVLLMAFSQQIRLRTRGGKCPALLTNEGRYFLKSDQGERFMVMEFCEGQLVAPGGTNADQMRALGREVALMHRVLNDGSLGVKDKPQFVPPSRMERLDYWKRAMEHAAESEIPEVLTALETQYTATERFRDELNPMQPGWAHRDVWVDNLLFRPAGVAAILDFDRLNYDYPQLDIARAVLSCALHSELDVVLVSAFMEGYLEEREVPEGYLVQGIRWLWYMESVWWVNANILEHQGPPARFTWEMDWLAKHLDMLPELLEQV
ncbi:phosphotransferase [Paenibacillus sp. FSL R5-0810]|uniref:phosphotransferase n=1 Tax=Paenibacillus sp. FSL R5-0810 TaxID=2921659 RepID=UPI0030F4F7CC